MHSHESIITTERSIRDVTQTRPRPLRRLDPRASNQRIHQVNQIVPPSLTYVAGNHRTPWPPVSPGARTSPWPCRTRAPRAPRGRVRRRCSHHHRASSRARPPSRTPRTVVVVVIVVIVIVIVIARGSDGLSSPQGPQGGAIDRSGLFEDIPIGEVFFVRVFLIHSWHSKILEYGEPGPKMHVRGSGSRPDAWNRARMRRDDLGARGVAGRLFQTQSSAMAAEQVRIDATRWTRDARERVEDARGRDRRRTRTARGAMGRRDVRARTL